MTEETTPKKRTRKAAAPAKPTLPWKAAGFVGSPLTLETGSEVMCARLTYEPSGAEVWQFRPMVVTEHGMMRDVQSGSVHPWHAITAYCSVEELAPKTEDLRK